ncbi:MAG: ATP-binding protein [Thermodesulfobacteriota bacterium]
MRIRTQFIITMVVFGALLLIVAVSAIVTNQRLEKVGQQERLAANIAQGAGELGYLANDYLVYRDSQQLKRWQSRFDSFSAEVAALVPDRPGQQALVADIKANQRRMKEVFDSIAAAAESPTRDQGAALAPVSLQVSWSRMAVQSQGLVSTASRLSHMLHQQMNRLTETRAILMDGTLVLFGVLLLASYMLTYRRILKSLTVLRAGTSVIGAGDLGFSIEETRNDEIGDLSRAFNRMTADLKTVTASKADLEREIAERRRVEEALRKAHDELEVRVLERTAELRNANEDLRVYAIKLEQTNRDLEDFAHVASHDLQEPLRKIQTFADLVMSKPREFTDDRLHDYLERMHGAAARMQSLVQDLLSYSRLTSKTDAFTSTYLREAVQEAVNDLVVLRAETEARIEVEDLPVVMADRVQMRQLFQNLISNALKYRSEREPVVRVRNGSSPLDPSWEIHVQDNGIGFGEEYLDKIFKPFQMLHGKTSPYEGTGMGLAICRRIVERHGGSITATSRPGEGSTFIVRLPKKR